MKLKTIQVSVETWRRLKRIQIETGETMDELVSRLLDNNDIEFGKASKPPKGKSQFGAVKNVPF